MAEINILARLSHFAASSRGPTSDDAEKGFEALIRELNVSDLRRFEADLQRAVSAFLPKREKRLRAALAERLGVSKESQGSASTPPSTVGLPQVSRDDLKAFLEGLRHSLDVLSREHIFQWNTEYRIETAHRLDAAFELARGTSSTRNVAANLGAEFARHSQEIFDKGFRHQTKTVQIAASTATTKSLAGLQQFLALPVEYYSARTAETLSPAEGVTLRAITSAALAGILRGFSQVPFGGLRGAQVLPRFPRSWAHYLAFMTRSDTSALANCIESGDLWAGIDQVVLPVLEALDRLAEENWPEALLPGIGEFNWERRRLDISINVPRSVRTSRYLEVRCFLDSAFLAKADLEDAVTRGVCLAVGPYKPDLFDLVIADELWRSIAVNVSQFSDEPDHIVEQAWEIMRASARRSIGSAGTGGPIRYNFAEKFPLNNPALTDHFRVHRQTVRDLLGSSEGKSGVRLWCSVRRSGKTTACSSLGSVSGQTTIVSQTCDSTKVDSGESLLYQSVDDALNSGSSLKPDFLREVIRACLPVGAEPEARVVLVLDEYETLFGRLSTAVEERQGLRYTVAQPLLNQLVAFSRKNLIVFVGQQPDAHFILLDQNQLSPYVVQDHFPLFAHAFGSETSEFADLVRRAITRNIDFEPRFLDDLFAEVGGHPFLAVSVLLSFFDWLIASEEPVSVFDREVFGRFAASKLKAAALARDGRFNFFSRAAGQALGPKTRSARPWLHRMYQILRFIGRECSDTLQIAEKELIGALAPALELEGAVFERLLDEGTMANFVFCRDGVVKPRVNVLARIAASAQPE